MQICVNEPKADRPCATCTSTSCRLEQPNLSKIIDCTARVSRARFPPLPAVTWTGLPAVSSGSLRRPSASRPSRERAGRRQRRAVLRRAPPARTRGARSPRRSSAYCQVTLQNGAVTRERRGHALRSEHAALLGLRGQVPHRVDAAGRQRALPGDGAPSTSRSAPCSPRASASPPTSASPTRR